MDCDAMKNVHQLFSKKKTFRDKFEVTWNFVTPHIMINHEKINKTVGQSMIWREVGNKEYTTAKNKDYLRRSIEAYTKSIAFAPVGSSELSLAYANRSAVLFKARLYEDCLLDIERSFKAGYPDKLKTKLFLRQSLCFKALKPNSHIESGISMASAMQWLPDLKMNNPKYDITKEYQKMINDLKEPRKIIEFIPEIKNDNTILVDASDAIKFKKTNENNQHIVATRDIKSGEFIYITEPFAATVSDKVRFTNCWHCCRQTWAGVPCDNCTSVIYCSDICKKKAWDCYHNLECLVLGHLVKSAEEMDTQKYLTTKLFFKTLNSAGGLIELKKKIDNIDLIKNEELIFTHGILNVNTFENFFNLDYFKAESTKCTFESALFVVLIVTIFGQETDILGEKMTMNDLIRFKNKKLFIMGEILLRYMMIVNRSCNSFFVNNSKLSTVILPFSTILKPSCDPNVDWTHVGSNVGYFAVKPIKQGELIFESIFGSYHTESKTDRYIQVEKLFGFSVSCKCIACFRNWPTIHSLSSYQRVACLLPTRIKRELKCMMLKLEEWQNLLDQKDPKKLLTIKDELNSTNDMLHQSITAPCKEKSQLYVLLTSLYIQLHAVHDIYE